MRYLQGIKDFTFICKWIDSLKVINNPDWNFVDYISTKKSTFGYIFMLANGVES